jgi:hypothetical protein
MKACDKAPKRSGYILFIIILAILVKLSLFIFVSIHAPQSKFMPDSHDYLKLADVLASKGVFARLEEGKLVCETFRTPGYPLFLAILNGILKIPLSGVVFLQVLMTLLAAFVTYKTALWIDEKIAFLGAAIMLFDIPVSIFSLLLLTETLFMVALSLFMLSFVIYLKNRKFGILALSAIILAIAVYIRPIAYYLGIAIFFFILYINRHRGLKICVSQALVFLVVTYSIIGAWQFRNYALSHNAAFSSVEGLNLAAFGLVHSYTRNTDPHTQGMSPLPYYINVSARCLLSLMTRQGNFKYFNCEILNVAGNILAYIWMLFWLAGFVIGLMWIKNNIYMQFISYIALYFILTSVIGAMWIVGERFRVPIMPFIAIISAYGWLNLVPFFKQKPIHSKANLN